MEIRLIPESFDPEVYNSKTTHPLQSWEWGEARKKTGLKIIRLGEFKSGKLVNSYLMTLHNIPITKLKIGYIPRSTLPSKQLLDFLKKLASENNILFIKPEPYIKKSEVNKSTLSSLKKSSHPLFTDWTILMDLSKDESTLLNNLKSKTRYNIKLSQKKGVYVKNESNNKGYNIFEQLYFETIKRQKYLGHNKQYHKNIWDKMQGKVSHILIAYYKNQPLSAYQLFIYKNRGYYVYGGSSNKYRNLMASNLLMWESLIYCKKLGCIEFDMWGSLSKNYSQSDPYSGFTRFKEGYGGEFTQMIGSYDLVINHFVYTIYNLIYTLRKLFLKI